MPRNKQAQYYTKRIFYYTQRIFYCIIWRNQWPSISLKKKILCTMSPTSAVQTLSFRHSYCRQSKAETEWGWFFSFSAIGGGLFPICLSKFFVALEPLSIACMRQTSPLCIVILRSKKISLNYLILQDKEQIHNTAFSRVTQNNKLLSTSEINIHPSIHRKTTQLSSLPSPLHQIGNVFSPLTRPLIVPYKEWLTAHWLKDFLESPT